MTKTLTALAAAATIAVTAIAVPQQAEARWRGGGAVIGGLATAPPTRVMIRARTPTGPASASA